MPESLGSPSAAFARSVVQRLRESGFEAWFAGGCVRDRLMGAEPKDYDVATSAPPAEVRRVFGRRSTVAVGEAFGVVVVHGPPPARPVEVATFRRDAPYSDARHPDFVEFTSGEEDARRRDFTINALFYDPIEDRTIDYVGGAQDLQDRVVRAVGDPALRFQEDHLRMLRAVRFAATLQFALDPDTQAAIVRHAESVQTVSAERIAAEMRTMLASPHRAIALELLRETRLLATVFPQLDRIAAGSLSADWSRLLAAAARLQTAEFSTALGMVFGFLVEGDGALALGPLAADVARRWRLARQEAKRSLWLAENLPVVRRATTHPWPLVQRRLVHADAGELLALAQARAEDPDHDANIQFCRQKLSLPREELDPAPLITGADLLEWGIERGPRYARILECVRDEQLDGKVRTVEEARLLVTTLLT